MHRVFAKSKVKIWHVSDSLEAFSTEKLLKFLGGPNDTLAPYPNFLGVNGPPGVPVPHPCELLN